MGDRRIRGRVEELYYVGEASDELHSLAKLEVMHDCEAELALLLKDGARHGFIRLDRILPFLKE